MIEKMKMVCVVSPASKKDEMLEGLKQLGLMHIAEKKAPDTASSQKFSELSKTASFLADYLPGKKSAEKANTEVLSDEEFEALYSEVLTAIERRKNLLNEISNANSECERLLEWGDFSVSELKQLKEEGFDFHFYKLGKNEYTALANDLDAKLIKLSESGKMYYTAVIGELPREYSMAEMKLPDRSLSEFRTYIAICEDGIACCEKTFRKAALELKTFNAQMLKAQNNEIYSAASESAEGDEHFSWLYGYIPEGGLEQFKTAAKVNGWAWAMDDVSEDDDQIPTKMKFGRISGLIEPIFKLLGILPGYRESDVSLWFVLFFTLFFAMIIGDGGYGAIILIGAIALIAKTKKLDNTNFLLLVLSIATLIWGAITGTWFGMESAMEVPFLKGLVIPEFASYPEYFGVDSLTTQNAIMKFSFSIGAIQMALGSLISIKRKLSEKDLSFVADLGWLIAIAAMYLLSLYLVIGENIPVKPVFALVGVAFALVVLFGGMSPDKTIAQGIKAGLADAFTVFLNTISCFGNVMSYIRLFAVGMAGIAISQSFNSIAAGFSGPLVVLGVVVVLIGHGLNLVMAFLSVVVHGVRLNVLEFSGQAGVEWTGVPYEPFKENSKLIK